MSWHVVEIDDNGDVHTLGRTDEYANARAVQDFVRAHKPGQAVFIFDDTEFERTKPAIKGVRYYDDMPHLDDGGIITEDAGVIAEVHPGEAVIPLDSPEGQEALEEAVTEAASEAIEEAAEEAIEEAVEVVGAAQEIAEEAAREVLSEEVRAAIRAEMTQFTLDLATLQELNQGVQDTPEPESPPVIVEDTTPEPSHWFFSPIRRNR